MKWAELPKESRWYDRMYGDFVLLGHCGSKLVYDYLLPLFLRHYDGVAAASLRHVENKTAEENALRKKEGTGIARILHHFTEEYVNKELFSRFCTGRAPMSSPTMTQAGQECSNRGKKSHQNWARMPVGDGLRALMHYLRCESEKSASAGARLVALERTIPAVMEKKAYWIYLNNHSYLTEAFAREAEPTVVCVRPYTKSGNVPTTLVDHDLVSAEGRHMMWNEWLKYTNDVTKVNYVTVDTRPDRTGMSVSLLIFHV